MVNFVVPGAVGAKEHGDGFSNRNPVPLLVGNQASAGGQAQSPRPLGSRDRDNKELQRLRNRPAAASQAMDRGDLTRLSQEAQLQQVAKVTAKYVDEMKDVCPDCSSRSFTEMTLAISPLRAEEAGFSTTTYARYYAPPENTALVYQQFFRLHFVMQASTLFHEYLHSLPGNRAMVSNATKEEGERDHPQRPWEAEAIRLERIFQQRFGQHLVKEKN